MATYQRAVEIAASADKVHQAVARRGSEWWTTNAVVDDRESGSCVFRFPEAGFHAAVRVTKNTPELLEWYCFDSLHPEAAGFKNRREWVGTTIRFRFSPLDANNTRLAFEHDGLDESLALYKTKLDLWAFYLESIRKLCETGKGDVCQGGRPGPAISPHSDAAS